MANQAIRKIFEYERLLEGKGNRAAAVLALAARYYVGFIVSRQRDFLHKANFVLLPFADSPDVSLIFMRVFVACELGNFDLAESLIGGLRSRRNTMKNQDANLYAAYLYLNCKIAASKDKERGVAKHYRALKAFCADFKPSRGNLMLAAASNSFKDYAAALEHLLAARKEGENSPFFYICLAEAAENARPQGSQALLLLPLIRWGFASGLYLGDIIAKNQRPLQDVLRKFPSDAEKLYAEHSLDWVLHIICTRRMIDNDLSEKAFYFYKEAETRQLHFQQLQDFLMRAAYKNGIEDISRYSLAQYLKSKDIPQEILPFAYHLALKTAADGRAEDLLDKIRPDVLDFACFAIDNRLFGRYYYSLYKFLLERALFGSGDKIPAKFVRAAEETIKNLLFAYEIVVEDSRVRRVAVGAPHMRDEVLYELKGGRVRVNLTEGKNVKITCFDEGLRNIIPSGLRIQKLVENVGIGLLAYFFRRGLDSPELLVTLAAHHMAQDSLDEAAADVLRGVVFSKQGGISPAFKMRARVALGNYYAAKREFKQAVECYRDINEAAIDPRHIEQMLLAYIHSGDMAAAARLAANKSLAGFISDKNLFTAVKRIATGGEGSKTLAGLAYEQLVRGWYDKKLLALVLEHHNTSLAGWIELAKSLAALGTGEPALYGRILETAILVRNADAGVQGIFVKLAEAEPSHEILQDFAMYLSFEIIINGLLPEYPAIYALEDIFLKQGGDFAAYALAHVYIKNSVSTGHSANILSKAVGACEENDIIWPIFKEIKDKSIIRPYIEENAPFLYRGRAGSAVCLYYRIGNLEADANFARLPMKYLGFGLFAGHIPHFYGEELEFYFEETREAGSLTTPTEKLFNNRPHLLEKSADLYYIINNALVFEQMFKYDNVEEIVTGKLRDRPAIRAKLM